MVNSFDKKMKIIFVIIFMGLILAGMLYYFIFESGYENLNLLKKQYSSCELYINSSNKKKELLKSEYNELFDLSEENCNEILKYNVSPGSAYFLYENIVYSGILSIVIPFFIPALIIFPCIYIITKKFGSNEIKNYLLRDNYKGYRKRIFKIAYSNIIIIPLALLLIFIISLIISKNLKPIADINFSLVQPNLIYNYNNPVFYLLYGLIIILNVAMYDNIALIVMSKNKNFLISYVESFLIVYIIWCISEIFLGNLFQTLFNVSSGNFSLLDIYRWTGVTNAGVFFLINIFWFVLTLLIMIHCYKDKEKIILMCER